MSGIPNVISSGQFAKTSDCQTRLSIASHQINIITPFTVDLIGCDKQHAVAFEVTPLKNKVSNTGILTFHRTRDKVSNLKVFVPVRPLEVSNKKEVPHFGCAYRWIFSSDTQRLARGRRQINICFCVRSKIHVFHCSLSSFSWNECSLVTAETPDTDCDKFTSPQPGSKMLFWPINRHQKDDPLQCA